MHMRKMYLMIAAAISLFSSAPAEEKPNILIVLSDDHSVPFLGCYGYPIQTPHLDAFSERAVRFTRFFTNAPQCVPSRASLMTGQAPSAVRMGRFSSPLPPDVPTLPGELRKAGYYNGVCGRTYHLDGSGGPWRPDDATDKAIKKNNLRRFCDNFDFCDMSEGLETTPDLLDDFLAKKPAESPFFMWINFQDPHYPWPGNDFTGTNPPEALPVPGYLPDLPSVRAALAAHCDEITNLDHLFGRILGVLNQHGMSDNTIVIFLGDNGLAFPHGKGGLHEPGLHVPFLIRQPGVTETKMTCDALCAGEDLMPTLLDLAGVEKPAVLRSVSFAPALRGEPFEQRKYMFGERGPQGIAPETTPRPGQTSNMFDFSRSVRSDQWKLIVNYTRHQIYAPVDSFKLPYWHEMQILYQQGRLPGPLASAYFNNPRPVFELYNLADDPDELNNIYGREGTKEITDELKTALLENMVVNYDFLPLCPPGEAVIPVAGTGH